MPLLPLTRYRIPSPHTKLELPADLANSSKSARVRSALKSVKRFNKEKKAESAIEAFITASKHAEGREKIAIQLELAKRYRHSRRYRKALEYYTTLQKRLYNRI